MFFSFETSAPGSAEIMLPVISSGAGGRKFQKNKETIGRSDALVVFASRTHVLYLERRTKSTFLSLLSLDFSIEISTFSELFYGNLYFLFTFLLKSLLSLNFPFEITTFSLLFY